MLQLEEFAEAQRRTRESLNGQPDLKVESEPDASALEEEISRQRIADLEADLQKEPEHIEPPGEIADGEPEQEEPPDQEPIAPASVVQETVIEEEEESEKQITQPPEPAIEEAFSVEAGAADESDIPDLIEKPPELMPSAPGGVETGVDESDSTVHTTEELPSPLFAETPVAEEKDVPLTEAIKLSNIEGEFDLELQDKAMGDEARTGEDSEEFQSEEEIDVTNSAVDETIDGSQANADILDEVFSNNHTEADETVLDAVLEEDPADDEFLARRIDELDEDEAKEAKLIISTIEETVEQIPDSSSADEALEEAEAKADASEELQQTEEKQEQKIERLVVRLLDTLKLKYSEEHIQQLVIEIIDNRTNHVDDFRQEQDYTTQEKGTRERKTKSLASIIVQRFKQKLYAHISLGNFVLGCLSPQKTTI
jgi:hypothetical protein